MPDVPRAKTMLNVPTPPDAEIEVTSYLYTDGVTWSAADDGGWLPGIYADEAAARLALKVIKTHYRALTAAVDADVRGIGEAYRPVTVEDLEALTAPGSPS